MLSITIQYHIYNLQQTLLFLKEIPECIGSSNALLKNFLSLFEVELYHNTLHIAPITAFIYL